MIIRAVVLAIAVLAAAVAACVAEREADAPEPTVAREDRGERPSRLVAEAPAVEQQAEEEESAEGAEEAVSEAEMEPEPAYVAGTIQSGWRAGVRADRNVLGDPDAEIVITEWSDYQ